MTPMSNVVYLPSPRSKSQPLAPWRRSQIDLDIAALQSLSQRLHQLKAPMQEASAALPDVDTSGSHHKLKCELGGLQRHLNDLDAAIHTLINVMTAHQGALHLPSQFGG